MDNKIIRDEGNFEDLLDSESSNTTKNKFKLIFFAGIYEIFYSDIPNDPPSFFSKSLTGVINLGISLQISSFLWRSDIQIGYWPNFENFWKFISFSRFDLLCAYLNLIPNALIIVNSTLLMTLLSIIFCQFMVFKTKKSWFIIRFISSKCVNILSTIFFIPFLTILAIDLKYYFVDDPTIIEYSVNNESSGNQLSLARSIISIIILSFINFLHENFTYEIRHIAKDKIITARAHGMVDLRAKLLYVVIIISYLTVYDAHPQIMQILILGISLYISIQYLYYLPYYSNFMNKLKILTSFMETIISISFLIGYLANTSGAILLLTIFLVPGSCLLVNWLVDYRYSWIKNIKKHRSSHYMVELKLRAFLSDCNYKNKKILQHLDKCFERTRDSNSGILGAWEMYYCLNVLKDVRLSFIKLSKCWRCPYSINIDYQRYKCSYELTQWNLYFYEDLSYIRYALKLENAKHEDKNLTINLLDFWGELSSIGDLKKLNFLASKIATGIINTKAGYEHLINYFPATEQCKDYYKSFLIDISAEEAPLRYLNGKMCANKEDFDLNDINYFDDANGIIIVSGNKKNIGEIIYSNSKFSEILDQPHATIMGSNISTFIPQLYSKGHNNALLRFVNFCLEPAVPFSGSLFLQTEKGYLIESIIKSKCSAINGNAFFLALIKKVDYNRHIFLCNFEGVIFSYSKEIVNFLKIPNLKMMNIKEIFNFDINYLEEDVMYKRNYKDKIIGVVKSFRKVGRTFMSVLLIYENEEKMKLWGIENNNNEEIRELLDDTEHFIEQRSFVGRVGFHEDNNSTDIQEKTKIFSMKMSQDSQRLDFIDLNKDKTAGSSSNSDSRTKYSKKILSEALRAIKIYKWILMLFVNNM